MTCAQRGRRTLRRWWARAALLLLMQPGVATAQPPLGGDFAVNSYTTGNQQRPAVAAGPAGDFVVAWSSNGSTGTDTSSYSIQARRFDAAGKPAGDQFQVNTYTTQTQTYPAVARNADGNFVVVWESDENSGSIKGQRYDSAGTPQGGEFPVSTTDVAFRPAVSMAPDGSFVAAWSGSTFGAGSEFSRVLAQRFAADGSPLGGEFQVNTLTTGNQWFPAVAVLPSGGFLIAFASQVSAGSDTDDYSVQARLYDGNGAPFGSEFQVNTYTPSAETLPEIAVDAAGDFVIAFHETGDSTDLNSGEIHARLYTPAALPFGNDFQVNTYTTGHQEFPEVAMDPAGGFVITWENVDVALPVQARRYAANGTPLADQFTVSESDATGGPDIAMDATSRFIAVFEDFPGTGGSGTEITARRFAGPPGAIPIKISAVKPGKLFKFVAKGHFPLPDPTLDNPTVDGGTLSFTAPSGFGQTYALPAACWRGLGPGGDGSKGFKCMDSACKVTVTAKAIKALCKGDTGTFALPEPGPVAIRLVVGARKTHYCGSCGGIPKGNPDAIFKQIACSAPVVCPTPTSPD